MNRIADSLIPRPVPEFHDGRIYEPKLECRFCGKPGQWRARMFGWNKVLGEVLCDECNSPNFTLPLREKSEEK